jgi:hypothetical protein
MKVLVMDLFQSPGIQEYRNQKKLALQNTQHFEEKGRRHCTVFKKFSIYIC